MNNAVARKNLRLVGTELVKEQIERCVDESHSSSVRDDVWRLIGQQCATRRGLDYVHNVVAKLGASPLQQREEDKQGENCLTPSTSSLPACRDIRIRLHKSILPNP